MKTIQFVNWFPEWKGIGFHSIRNTDWDMRYIFDWFLWFGFWEIRKWHKLTGKDKRELE